MDIPTVAILTALIIGLLIQSSIIVKLRSRLTQKTTELEQKDTELTRYNGAFRILRRLVTSCPRCSVILKKKKQLLKGNEKQ